MSFSVGDTFSSYNELLGRVKSFEETTYSQLVHRDSRTLEAAAKRVPKKVEKANKELVYYTINLTCVFGGKKYQNRGTGVRPQQRTFKQNCPAGIKLGLTEDCQSLIVTDINLDHNHATGKEIYCHLPKQRKLDEASKGQAKELLKLKVNKKLLQEHLSSTSGKVVTLKDISNIQSELGTKSSGNNLDDLVTRLRSIEGSTVNLFIDEQRIFTGLFFQDAGMKYNFECYPEVLMVDATYKLNELRMPLYLMMVIDGNGQSEIIAMFLTSLETKQAITDMIRAFKEVNPAWQRIGVVISDKDFTERSVFSEEFPGSTLQLCLFHVLRSFRREITCDKLGLRPGERDYVLELLTKLVYSSSEEEYEKHYAEFLKSSPQSVIQYYDANWHSIRDEWVECYKSLSFTLGEKTNNRLESINGKLKSVCSRFASLSCFFDHFFAVLSVLRNERDHSTVMALVGKPVSCIQEISPDLQNQFANLLTPYAQQFVVKQLLLRRKVKFATNEEDGSFVALSQEGTLTVTSNLCHCKFATTMKLPCRHVFAVREKQELPLYSSDGIAERWKLTYLKEVFGNKCTTDIGSFSYKVTSTDFDSAGNSCRALSQHQKFVKAKKVVDMLPSLASEVGMKEFTERIDVLQCIHDIWAHGRKVIVVEEDDALCDNEGTAVCVDGVRNEEVETDVEIGPGNEFEVGVGNEVEVGHCDTEYEVLDENLNEQNACSEIGMNGHESDVQDAACSEGSGIQGIILPPKLKKRGRPKGAEKTVIGLPAKKRKARSVIPFLKKLPAEKEKVILLWFVDPAIAETALSRRGLIQEDGVEVLPERVTACCLDENVNLQSCRKYFTSDGWLAVQNVVEAIKKDPVWYCGRCTHPINDGEENSIQCGSCLIWYHFECTNLKNAPKKRHWFCRSCY